jgi:hypothetical protein
MNFSGLDSPDQIVFSVEYTGGSFETFAFLAADLGDTSALSQVAI